jgi:hypothetical protein
VKGNASIEYAFVSYCIDYYLVVYYRLKFSSLLNQVKTIVTDSVQREQILDHAEKLTISPPVPTSNKSSSTSSTTANTLTSTALNNEYPPKSAQLLRKYCIMIVVLVMK